MFVSVLVYTWLSKYFVSFFFLKKSCWALCRRVDKLIPVGVWVQREYLFACFALGDGDGDDGNECVG